MNGENTTRMIRTTAGETTLTVDNGLLKLTVDLKNGTYDVNWRDGASLIGMASACRLHEHIRRTTDYNGHIAREEDVREVQNGIGNGLHARVTHTAAERPSLTQHFVVYEDQPFLTVRIELDAADGEKLETNYMAPVSGAAAGGAVRLGLPDEARLTALFVPFDNDKWVRYDSVLMPGALESYEASAVYDPASRKGLVVGSIRHDTWKTGIKLSSGTGGAIDSIEVYAGAAGELTRDSIPHGSIKGTRLASPDIFIGAYADYRVGLEAFGRANAAVEPALSWDHDVPFGWNSWSAAADKLDYELYVSTSDFLREIRDRGFHNNGVVYINFDSFWTNLTTGQLEKAVSHVRGNGQKAGIYWTPFAFWGQDIHREVEGTDGRYKYEELLLRDPDGNVLPSLDGGLAIDPTHPGNLMRTDYHLNRFAAWGFEYVKLDFLGHGALEGSHYDSGIQTGIQAYNLGMDYIRRGLAEERIGRPFHINLSIAPLFPYQYGHSRRISCDAFGTLSDTEYMLNALTGGWWMNNALYRFNDPDHTVLFKSFNQDATSYQEGRSRLNASVISGTVLLMGDDFRNEEARLRASEWLANDEVMALARRGETFVPVEGSAGSGASEVFMLTADDAEEQAVYLAVFNFDKESPAAKTIALDRIGAQGKPSVYRLKDLWTGDTREGSGSIVVHLEAAESTLLRLSWQL